MVDPREPQQIISPVSGTEWASFNGCCTPNRHRDTRIGAGTRIATAETFDIDWLKLENGRLFSGDGSENTDYFCFGAPIVSATDGIVVDARDGVPDSIPNIPPTNIHTPRDFSGNFVVVRVRPKVYAIYAHLELGSVTVKIGDIVKAGTLLGRLGSSGNSTAPHLHFGIVDQQDPTTANSLPFVIDNFELTGIITGDENNLNIQPVSRSVTDAYPLVLGVATFK